MTVRHVLVACFLVLSSLAWGDARAEVSMYFDRTAFVAATSPTLLAFPARLAEPFPTCPQEVTYGVQVDFSFGTNNAHLTAPNAIAFPTCYPQNFGPLLALIPAGYVDNSQNCPFPVDTLTGHGEDDMRLIFDVPVHAVAFELWSNSVADEAVTLIDGSGDVLASVSLDPLTTACKGRFFGVTSTIPIKEVFLDTAGGGFSNGGYGAILVSEAFPPPGPSIRCDQRPSRVVSWWTGDGTPADRVGRNHGLFVGPATYEAGQVGQAFRLLGSSQFIDVGAGSSLDNSGDETIEMWVKLNRFQTTSSLSYLYGDFDTTGNRAQVSLRTSNGRFGYYHAHTDGSILTFDGPPTLQLGRWTHLAAVRDDSGKTVTLYVDGRDYASANYPGKTVIPGSLAGTTAIGRAGSYDGDYVDGLIDEVAAYSRSLTACEVEAIYLSGRMGLCKGNRDADDLRDFADNCPQDPNNGQSDLDGDGVGDVCDCDDFDPTVYRLPADFSSVRLGQDGDPHRLDWCLDELGLGPGTLYDVVRGALHEFPVGSGTNESCIASGLTEPNLVDSALSDAGKGLWYLVRGRNGCGVGTWGFRSDGGEHSLIVCP